MERVDPLMSAVHHISTPWHVPLSVTGSTTLWIERSEDMPGSDRMNLEKD